MAWGRLHDRANGNGKLLALSDAGWRMWGCGLIYCQDNLTDGFIPEAAIFTFGVKARNKIVVADELCQSLVPGRGPLWHKVAGGYQVHDFLDWNDPREKVLAERAKIQERVGRFRKRRSNGTGNALQHTLRNGTETPLVSGDPLPLPQGTENSTNSQSGTRDSKPHPIKDFLTLHEQLFTQRFGRKPAKYTKADAAIAKDVLDRHDVELAHQILRGFMTSREPFILKAGFGVNVFRSQVNKLLTESGGRLALAPDARGHVPPCATNTECNQRLEREIAERNKPVSE